MCICRCTERAVYIERDTDRVLESLGDAGTDTCHMHVNLHICMYRYASFFIYTHVP